MYKYIQIYSYYKRVTKNFFQKVIAIQNHSSIILSKITFIKRLSWMYLYNLIKRVQSALLVSSQLDIDFQSIRFERVARVLLQVCIIARLLD